MSTHPQPIEYSPFSIQISSGTHPKTLADLDSFHKDSLYELVSAARGAYLMKLLAGKLATHVTKSSNVRDMSHLITDSARELERSLRMAACIANAPVSTTYPYLPLMPTKLVAPITKSAAQSPGAASVRPPLPRSQLPSTTQQGFAGHDLALLSQLNICQRRIARPRGVFEFI